MRRKVGLVLGSDADRKLDAMSFVTGKDRSKLVEEGIDAVAEALPEPKKSAVEAAIEIAARS